MEAADLSMQLGIGTEDALFLQQVLSEVESVTAVPDLTATPTDSEITADITCQDTTDISAVVEEANNDEILQKVPQEDNESTSRFSSAIWYDKIQQQTIILAGLGGIGSWVSILLSRMRPVSMFIYDDDVVEQANISGQLYSTRDVGSRKTAAALNNIRDFSGYGDVFAISERFDSTCQAANIMICGFDNMEARKTFFNRWVMHVKSFTDVADRGKCLFIDGRLAAESFQVFCIKGDDSYSIEKYEDNWLFDDGEAEETICSYKQTSFCANMIASVMVNCFVNFIANQCNPLIPRDVPFFTEYDASMMFFKTES